MPRLDKSAAKCPTSIAAQFLADHNESPDSAAECWTTAWTIHRWQTAGACFFRAGLPSAPTGAQSWQAGCRQSLSPLQQCRKCRSICGCATVATDRGEINLRQIHVTQARDALDLANGTGRNFFSVPQICKDSP